MYEGRYAYEIVEVVEVIVEVVEVIKCSNFSKIVKMLVRSCFLITLIKCLKGHKSLGLFLSVKSKRCMSDSVSDKVTY